MEEFLDNFKDLEKDLVKIISVSSAKGIIASSIIARVFDELDVKFSLSFVKDLDKNIGFLKNEAFTALILLGFEDYKIVKKEFKDEKIFVLSENVDTKDNSLRGDIVENCYLVAKEFIKEDLSKLAFMFNKDVETDLVIRKQGIKINNSVSLLEALMYGFDLFIPEVNGEEDKIKDFLNGLRIEPEMSFLNLSDEEKDKLSTAILINMLGSYDDLNEEVYIFKNEKGLLRCVKEFKLLLSFLAKINKESLGVGVCLDNENSKKIAINLYLDYKKDIINSLKWFCKNRKTNRVVEKKNFVFINAEDRIKDVYLEKILELLNSFKLYNDGTFVFAMSYTLEEESKIALRLCGNKDFDVRKVLKDILKEDVNGDKDYAYGLISQDKEKEILKKLMRYSEDIVLEEKVK